MMRISIGPVSCHATSSSEVKISLEKYGLNRDPCLVVTPYSEMIVWAEERTELQEAIEQADWSLPDGKGILWASLYLYQDLSFFQSMWYILNHSVEIYHTFPEQISGSNLIYDLLNLAHMHTWRLYVVGGSAKVAQAFRSYLDQYYPRVVLVNHYTDLVNLEDQELYQDISDRYVDVVFVALSTPDQEVWAHRLIRYLREQHSTGVVCCFGGSLDMVVGKQQRAPQAFRNIGLEWLWRLGYQPLRLRRAYRATWQFMNIIRSYKE